MGKSLKLIFSLALCFVNLFLNAQSDKEILEKSVDNFRTIYPKFDSIIKNFDIKKTIQLQLNSVQKIYYFNNENHNLSFLDSLGSTHKTIILINNKWLDSVGVNLDFLHSQELNVKFNGCIIYKFSKRNTINWVIFENSKISQEVFGADSNIKDFKFPKFYNVIIQGKRFSINSSFKGVIEYFYNDNINFEKDTRESFLFQIKYNLSPFKKEFSYFQIGNKSLQIVNRKFKILNYRVFNGDKLTKLKPKKDYEMLISSK